MATPVFQVDSFTDVPFKGNPAGVCLLDAQRDPAWMQNVAAEMNLAETAFVRRTNECFELRWFTPTVEVDLCGHATLASAHVIWETAMLGADEIAKFKTRSGVLACVRRDDWIEMDFPATEAREAPVPEGLLESLGISRAAKVARSKFDWLVQIESQRELRELSPDFVRLKRIEARGVIVTARSSDDNAYDFVARFFAPQSGIDEDPVTGSAYCALGPWWRGQLAKDQLSAYQASRRGGIVRMTCAGDRVHLRGRAVTTLRGELTC